MKSKSVPIATVCFAPLSYNGAWWWIGAKHGAKKRLRPWHFGRSSQDVDVAALRAATVIRTDAEVHVSRGAESAQQEAREDSVLLLQSMSAASM